MNSISWFRTAGIPRLDASVVARMLLAERRPGVQDRPDRHHLGTPPIPLTEERRDRKSTRLNSSHANISYAVFCLKKKTKPDNTEHGAHLSLTAEQPLRYPTTIAFKSK